MKKLFLLVALAIVVSPVLAGSSWIYGYTSSRGLISDYYSTAGYHGSKVYDRHDGSYETETTSVSKRWVYTDTPSRSNWSGIFTKYE